MRFAFVASDTSVAQQALRKLVDRYGDVPPAQAFGEIAHSPASSGKKAPQLQMPGESPPSVSASSASS